MVEQCNAPSPNWYDPRNNGNCAEVSKDLPPCSAYTEYFKPNRNTPARRAVLTSFSI